MENKDVDYTKLPPELRSKLSKWSQNKQGGNNKVMSMVSDLPASQLVGATMAALQKIKDSASNQETAEELVMAVQKLSQAADMLVLRADPNNDVNQELASQIASLGDTLREEMGRLLNLPPPQINVPEPQVSVNVDAPDLDGITKKLDTSFSQLTKSLTKLVPEYKETDLTPVVERLDKALDALTDIDKGVRMKPLPGTMKVTNPDGTSIGSGGSSATQYTEGDTDATVTGTAMMMEGAGNALVPAQGTVADGQLVNLGSNNDVTVTSIVPGTTASSLGKAEDASHTTGDVGVFALSVANEAQTTLATDGDYIARATDTKGNSTNVGNVASGATDAGNPVKIGGVGKTANPTAVTDGQRVNATFDKLGKQVVVGSIRILKGRQVTTITSSTAETTIITAVASTFCDVYGLIISNSSATASEVTIKDSTAGTTVITFEVPALETRGLMLPESGAINQTTVNNNWTATCGTSVASIKITALYVQNT